jgi:PAS domain S-box-containing protein
VPGWTALIGTAYFLASRLGLSLLITPSDVAVFWPAAGIGAGILIAFGRRALIPLVIGVMIGTVAANVLSDRSLATAVFKGICNVTESVILAWLLERWFGRAFSFGDLRQVLGFLTATVLAAATSAIGGAATITLLHTTAPFWDVWRVWLLSDGVGIVLVAPLIIEARRAWVDPPSPRDTIEGAAVLAVLGSLATYVYAHPTESWISFDPDAFILPLLLWLAARWPSPFAIVGAFIVSTAAVATTIFGIGHLSDVLPVIQRVHGVQTTVIMITVFTLVLVALFAQRKEAEESLAKERAMLARLHEVGSRLWLKRDLGQALDEILAGAIELLVADKGTIRILDTTQGVLKIEAQRGFTTEILDCFGEVPADGDSPCCRALRSAERIVIADVEVDELFSPFRPIARAAGYRAAQSTPIMSREGARLGTLATHFRSARNPSNQDLRLLDLYVRQAADIIERHQADDALRESEERLRLAQLKTGIGLWDWDLRTGRVTWTPELEAIFGLEPKTVKTYADFRSRVHPDDIERVESERDAAIHRREQFKVEFRIIRSDRAVRWILAMGGAFYDAVTGEPTRVLGNNLDITDRKLAENVLVERNAQIALTGKAVLVGTYAHDLVTNRIRITEGYAALHGLSEETTEIPLSRWQAGVHPDDLGRLEALRDQACRERRREYTTEYRIIRGGAIRWIEARKLISYDSDGRPQRTDGVNIDVTERKRVEEQQRVLLGELDHRVKNSLATVSAVVSHTLSASRSMADFASALDGRVQSMARAHELLSASGWQGLSVAELVRRELEPYATTGNTEIDGPNVILKAEAGQAFAMVLHELATNAAKYGALSTQSGRVAIRWGERSNGHSRSHLVLEWREVGGPSVVAPEKSGFGTHTIRDLITYEFGGMVDLVLAPEGVRCRLELPSDWLRNDRPHSEIGASPRIS